MFIAVPAAPSQIRLAQATLAQPTLTESDLQELERLLSDLGFDPGPVDGVVDEATVDAIQRYQDFALLSGPPEPSRKLLAELRGVAAAFASLRNDQPAEPGTAPDVPQAAPGDAAPEEGEPPAAGKAREKIVVPPPPVPPKLKPLDAIPETAPDPEPTQAADPPEDADPPQVAARPPAPPASPPAAAPPPDTPAQTEVRPRTDGLPADVIMDRDLLDDPDVHSPAEPPAEDPAARRARIDAELLPYRSALAGGSLTRADLAKQFNEEGRQLLAAADYEAAVVKFDVAISLNPRFAGAYSNRGTAYEMMGERALALEDFSIAKRLGFGGLRLK
ncbi:peptidoglycan-binding protein [Pelagibius sp.]|uniref:peptidoglycan-binding protein n=1 Tax=Pelagibius sp. TaxID=1931238 RepID=UPI002627EE84|nr:peptidoglycan-binding protein [Pelagibius sp.]